MPFSIQTFRGKVYKRPVGKGSKSDRIANAILTDDGRDLVLRREGANALEDMVLDALEGKTVTVTGVVHSYVFIVHDFREEKEKNIEA